MWPFAEGQIQTDSYAGGIREEDRDQLVAALADLAPCLLEADVVSELRHRFVP